MIARTIKESVLNAIKNKPVVLITGARQVGKSTLCGEIKKEYNYGYVSLDNLRERETAIRDPELFLSLHKAPLIIDEVQYAPKLLDVIESIVNKVKFEGGNNKGMYILTGSQIYSLMENVSESLAGRVSIIEMSPFSLRETKGLEELPFVIDPVVNQKRSRENNISVDDLYKQIVKGFYPELYDNPELDSETFYSDYVKTYIERDVSQIINLNDKLKFQRFMEVLASLTGEEFVGNNLAKSIGVSLPTIESWLSVLVAGNIVYLLEPYNEHSTLKRAVKRPKLYFADTGLACYLARLNNMEVLRNSIFSGRFVETYIVNEIIKSYKNNNKKINFYYYRDADQKEIDLIMIDGGTLHFIECKSGVSYSKQDVSAFYTLKRSTKYKVGNSAIVCSTNTIYSIEDAIYAVPVGSI
jgi:predicted AAA+ superfamily ATPase